MDLVAEADGAVPLKVFRDPSAPDMQVRPHSLSSLRPGTRAAWTLSLRAPTLRPLTEEPEVLQNKCMKA